MSTNNKPIKKVFLPNWSKALMSVFACTTIATTITTVYFAVKTQHSATYTVTLDLDGGEISGGTTQKVIPGTLVGQLPTPYRVNDNKVFKNWNNLNGEKVDPETPINSDIELKAVWEDAVIDAHTVTFNLDGGTLPGIPVTPGQPVTIKVNDKTLVGKLPSPSKNGWSFAKWVYSDHEETDVPFNMEITKDISIKAVYTPAASNTILGGSRLLEIETHTEGKDQTIGGEDNAWKLYEGSSLEPITEGVEWTITDTQETPAEIPGLSIDAGVVKWKDLAAGNYTARVTGTKDTITASAVIGIVVTDASYTIDGIDNLNIKNYEEGASSVFKLNKNGSTLAAEGVKWTMSLDKTPTSGSIEIKENENVIRYSKVSADTYTATVTGTDTNTGLTATKKVTINSIAPETSISGGSTLLNIETYTSGSDTAWTLYEGTEPCSGVKWEITDTAGEEIKGLSIGDDGKVTWANTIEAGKYTAIVKGSVPNTTITASETISIIVADATYTVKGIDNLNIKDFNTGTSSAFTLHKNGATEAVSGVAWSISLDKQPTSGSIDMSGNQISYSSVTAGTYIATVTGTVNGTSLKGSKTVTINSTTPEASISGGSTLLNIETFTTGKDQTSGGADKPWKLYEASISTTDPLAATWTIKDTAGNDIDGLSIDSNGVVNWNTNIKAGEYTAIVKGTGTGTQGNITSSMVISVVVTNATYTITGIDNLNINDYATSTSSVFTLNKNGSALAATDATWSMSLDKTPTSGSIKIEEGANVISYSGVTAGTYTATITGTDKTTHLTATKTVTITSALSTVSITGADTISAPYTSEYTASVSSSAETDNIEWKITGWTGTDAAEPELSETTNGIKIVTKDVENIQKDENTPAIVTLQAKDKRSNNTTTKDIEIVAPWVNSSENWVYNDNKWGSITETSTSVTVKYAIDESEASIEKSGTTSGFNNKVYIGENVMSIPTDFLSGCTYLTNEVVFPTNSKCMIIGSYFLAGCTSFNQKLELPDTVEAIGEDFLKGCSAFNNGNDETTAGEFSMPDNLGYIGDEFLLDCVKFNQSITIAATVTSIGNQFMQNCDAMDPDMSTITINADAYSFKSIGTSLTLVTKNKTSVIYSKGIKLAGSAITDFKTVFPALEDDTDLHYRKYA